MTPYAPPWWRGARGEWWVAAQEALILLVLFGPRNLPGWPGLPFSRPCTVLGVALMLPGAALALAGLLRLGPNLTPFPRPRDAGTLVTTGPYRLVRHPVYAGGVLFSFGWALFVQGWLTVGYATLVLFLVDAKAGREERWLEQKFAGYPAYRKRVRKLIPFLY